mgnify:CR=1 FL=1
MEGSKPGRIVYYTDGMDQVHPAIVTRVHTEEGCINLLAFVDGQTLVSPHSSVLFGEGRDRWKWMFEGQQTRYRPDRVELPTAG